MDCGLRMYDHADLRGRQVEQSAGLDDLETFVHQRRRINGDAVAHFPCGMIQRLGNSDTGKFGYRSIQKRSARSGEPDTADFSHPTTAQALMDGIMLAINRKKRLALPAGFGGDEFSGSYEAFFVGKTHGFSRFDGFVSGFQPRNAYDRADHEIAFRMSSDCDRSACAVHNFYSGDSG